MKRRPDVADWPLATDRIFTADGRFGCEADIAGPSTGSTRSLVTRSRRSAYGVQGRCGANFSLVARS